MSKYRDFIDWHCMPMPFGLLCRLEDHFPRRDTQAIHRTCELEDTCESRNGPCEKRCHLYCVVQIPDNNGHPREMCPEEDWICKLHDNALNILAHLNIPICRGTWKK